ncbi:MAG: hypothetical protein LBJ73_01390 [Rickettsiales bacterium]|jgi:hypothetical protein|nr:hypothetical protein [Rickettsiales bacterium]
MKKLYFWVLLTLSFGSLNAGAQSREKIDRLKKYTTEYLNDALASDANLRIDTIWIENKSESGVYSGGRYDMYDDLIVLNYLATRLEDQELQDKIDMVNANIPVTHRHEEEHKRTLPKWNKGKDFGGVGKSFGWSAYDLAQLVFSDEVSARLSEPFAIRSDLESGRLSQSDVKTLAKNMHPAQKYLYDYYAYIAEHGANGEISMVEADMMLDVPIKWMTDRFSAAVAHGIYASRAVAAAKYLCEDYALQFKKHNPKEYDKNLYDNKLYKNKDFAKNEQFLDFDDFMRMIFGKSHNSRYIDIFKLTSDEKRLEFLKTIASILQRYEQQLNEIESNFAENPGWRKSKAKLADMPNNKKAAERHAASQFRAAQFAKE